jgi:uncharacterized membrane protein YgdD (TMEM256/DUF423 family)
MMAPTDPSGLDRTVAPGPAAAVVCSPALACRCIVAGALLMLLAVILGAFGAHALQSMLTPRQLASYQTGVLYHQLHALGLIVVGIVVHVTPPTRWVGRSAAFIVLGIALFSGSIYAMTFGAPRWLGMVAPLGGTSFMVGWACLAVHGKKVISE